MPRHCVEHLVCVHWTRPERAYCSHAPEPTRRPHGFGSLCSTTPRAPLLAALCQAAPAAPGRPRASRRRRRQPLLHSAPPKPPRLATWPRHSPSSSTRVSASVRRRHVALATERRFAGELIPPAAEPTSSHYKWRPPSLPEHAGDLMLPPRCSPASHSTRGGLLHHLRQLLPPPPPRPIRHLQYLPLSVLSTKNFLIPLRTQPPT